MELKKVHVKFVLLVRPLSSELAKLYANLVHWGNIKERQGKAHASQLMLIRTQMYWAPLHLSLVLSIQILREEVKAGTAAYASPTTFPCTDLFVTDGHKEPLKVTHLHLKMNLEEVGWWKDA